MNILSIHYSMFIFLLIQLCIGKKGLCHVDQTEEGWYVQYIDRSPAVLARAEELRRREEQSKDSAQRADEEMEKQIALANEKTSKILSEYNEDEHVAHDVFHTDIQPSAILRSDNDTPLTFTLHSNHHTSSTSTTSSHSSTSNSSSSSSTTSSLSSSRTPISLSFARPLNVFQKGDDSSSLEKKSATSINDTQSNKRKLSTLEQLIAENEERKLLESKKLKQEPVSSSTDSITHNNNNNKIKKNDYWLYPHMIVKILNKTLLNGILYKEKAVVLKVLNKYVGELQLLSNPSIIVQVDCRQCESVLPGIGKRVLICNGMYTGETATLVEVDEKK